MSSTRLSAATFCCRDTTYAVCRTRGTPVAPTCSLRIATRTGSFRYRLAIARNARRHRGREERGLTLRRQRVENRLQVVGEPHVEHLVGFVEHDALDVGQLERAALDVIDRAPRRGDDDVDPALQGAKLLLNGLATVDRDDAGSERVPVLVHRLGDLHRQLPRRNEDERARPSRLIAASRFVVDALEQRQRERRRLSRSRGRLTEQVASLEQRRDGLALDGRGLLVAERCERFEQRVREAESPESIVGHVLDSAG